MYWGTGIANSPELVQVCMSSWQRQNPSWTVTMLDESNLSSWAEMSDIQCKNPHLPIQAYADILRWRLLASHGGIWADATLYCCRPLNEWLFEHLSAGDFFVFRTSEYHLYNNWFIAGMPHSPTVQAMNQELDRFFITYGGIRSYWSLRGLWRLFHFVETHIGRFNQEFWSSTPALALLKLCPYYQGMYLMGPAIRKSLMAHIDFYSLTTQFGDSFHDLQTLTGLKPCIEFADLERITSESAPVQKLTNKRYAEKWQKYGVLNYLDQYGRE